MKISRAAKELIFVAAMKDVWDRIPLTNDSTETIAEDRDR